MGRPFAFGSDDRVTTQADQAKETAPADRSAPIKAMIQSGRFQDAEKAACQLLAEEPDHKEALYLAAVAERYLKHPDTALAHLKRLLELDPTYGRAYQERGHTLMALGDSAGAESAYWDAVKHNPALVSSWTRLASLIPATDERSGNVSQVIAQLKALPPDLISAKSMMHEDRLYAAERLCRAFLQKNKSNVEGMRLLAELGVRLGILDDAEFLLETALTFQPDHTLARLDYITVLQRRQRYAKAQEQAELLYRQDASNPAFATAYANALMAVGEFTRAVEIYDGLAARFPEIAVNHLVRGHALKTMGRQSDAIAAYHQAHTVKPDFGDAYWSLANLKTYRFTDEEIAAMKAAEAAASTAPADRYHLCFALGKALEDKGDYGASFSYYERGNALKHEEVRYSADRTDSEFLDQKAFFTEEFLAAHRGVGTSSNAPIFIVGLPRAGSTLLEQILASHSQVDGTLELPNILALVHRLNGRRKRGDAPRYPGNLSGLEANTFREFGEAYIEDTRVYRQSAPRFTDKMPNNFRHIGLIHLILPNAKIIDARRDAMGCCFSGFKQLFAEGQEFTYGLEDIGRYYRGYVDLMDHWHRVLPGKILHVQYEDVVADLDGQVRRVLDFCELPFEDACIDFHQTDRSVRTASSEQVRQPIYQSGVDHWQKFEPYLGPLKSALGPVLQGKDE